MNLFRRGFWPFLIFALLFSQPYDVLAREKIKIVTSIPTLMDFAMQVGGERVEVVSLLKGGEDLHTFDPRPSDTKAVYKADILIKLGVGLDGWVDRIAKASGNKRLLVTEASQGIEIISTHGENPSHSHGNPHIWHDPENAKIMLENIFQVLIKGSPSDADYFRTRKNSYMSELAELNSGVDAAMSGIKDRRVVTYHPGWAYLLRRLGISELFSIERVPGKEPSAKEIARSIDMIKNQKIKLVLGEPEAPKKVLNIIARESGAQTVNLAPEVGSLPQAGSYIEMMRYNAKEIAKGLK